MFSIQTQPARVCSGFARRNLLQAAGAGLFGLSLPRLLQAEALLQPADARAKSVIFLFLFGGPSQLETFDLKPKAPSTLRGPFKPIGCRTHDLLISEHLRRCAQISDQFCVVRSLTHPQRRHSAAAHYIQTGHPWQITQKGIHNTTSSDWPSIGSVTEYLAQNTSGDHKRELPAYVTVPNYLGRLQGDGLRRPGGYAGWLGGGYDPLMTLIDKRGPGDNPYFRDCTDEELDFQIEGLAPRRLMTLDRLDRRQTLLAQFDARRRALEDYAAVETLDQFRQRAMALATSEKTRQALDIRRESNELRDRYGRHLFGQATLMARRLVEAGVRFVTVNWDTVDGYSWDSHRSSHHLEKHLIPGLDQALSALLTDLQQRGLLEETLVVAVGEMGRTPTANGKWGRGHWPDVFPAVLAGAGIRGGAVYGSSDKDAAYPQDNPTTPEDLAATIYYALGIDPERRITNSEGRPTPIVHNGRPLLELFA